jgi:hypothetical protein
LEVVGAEGVGQQLAQRALVEQHVAAPVLVEELAAAPARHERIAVAIDARHRHQHAATGGVQGGHEAALGAQGEAVRGVLDVAGGEDATVVHQAGDADREVGVRDVSASARVDGLGSERGPVDLWPRGHRDRS